MKASGEAIESGGHRGFLLTVSNFKAVRNAKNAGLRSIPMGITFRYVQIFA
jgi:hypothetical protein